MDRMFRHHLVFAASLAIAGFASGVGCSSNTCGSGTVNKKGTCVPAATAADACGAGTQLKNGHCVPVDGSGTCAAGTQLVSGQCVPIPPPATLAGFSVTVAPKGCDTLVSAVGTATVTVTALDADGNTLSDFAGTVSLEGLGGITVTPSTAGGFTGGVATVDITPSGVSDSAQVGVFEASTLQAGGVSQPFSVVAEQTIVTLTGPAGPVRAGADVTGVSASLATNACAPATDFDGTLLLSLSNTTGATVQPGQVAVTGAGPHDLSPLQINHVDTPQTVTVAANIAGGVGGSFDLQVVPSIDFAGLQSALAQPGGDVALSWTAATGGSGAADLVYHVYRSTTAGQLGSEVATVNAPATGTTASVSDLNDGDVAYFTVRVTDALDDGYDQNMVQVSVVKGPILYVDAANTADPGTGAASDPYASLGAALAAASAGTTIYVGAQAGSDTYAELPLTIPTGVQLVGGFTGFTDSSTTAADWTRDPTLHSSLDFGMPVSPASSPAVTLSDNSRVEGIAISTNLAGAGALPVFINADGTTGASLIDDDLEGVGGLEVSATAATLIINNSTINNNATTNFDCIDANSADLTLVATTVSQCDLAAIRAAGSATVRVTAGSSLASTHTGVVATDSDVLIDNSSLTQCSTNGVQATGGGVVLHNVTATQTGVCLALADPSALTVSDSSLTCASTIINASVPNGGPLVLSLENNTLQSSGTGVLLAGTSSDLSLDLSGNTIQAGDQPLSLQNSAATGAATAMLQDNLVILNAYSSTHSALSLDLQAGSADGPSVALAGNRVRSFVYSTAGAAGGLAATISSATSSTVSLQGNSVDGAEGRPGMDISVDSSADSAVTVTGNQVKNVPLYVTGGPATLTDDDCSGAVIAAQGGGTASLTFSNNTMTDIGTMLAGIGTGYGAHLLPEGNVVQLTAANNVLTGERNTALQVAAVADLGTDPQLDAEITGNELGCGGGNGNGMSVVASAAAGSPSVTIDHNTIDAGETGIDVNQTSDIGPAPMPTDLTSNLTVTNNTVHADFDAVGVTDTFLTPTAGTMTIQGNALTTSREGLDCRASMDGGAQLTATVADNVVGPSQDAPCIHALWDATGASTQPAGSFSITGNVCGPTRSANSGDSTSLWVSIGSGTGVLQSPHVDVSNNTLLYAANYPAISVTSGNTQDLQETVDDNFIDGTGSTAITVSDNSTGGTQQVDVSRNVMFHTGYGVSVFTTDNQPTVTIANNLLVNDPTSQGGPLSAYVDGSSGSASTTVEHNTLVNTSQGLSVDAVQGPLTVRDNLLQGTTAATPITAIADSAADLTQTNNLTQQAPTASGDVQGDAQFVAPVAGLILASSFDPTSNTFAIVSGPAVPAGVRLHIGTESVARTVLAVNAGVVTVDGPPLADLGAAQLLIPFYWPASYVAPNPDYHLAAGSAGIGAATDGGNVGAYGGATPLAWP